MIKLIRTNSGNQDFIELVNLLDKDLKVRDGAEHEFFAQYNKLDMINNVVVAYLNELPIACGAFKEYANSVVEIKRMYTAANGRGQGIATQLLSELEAWAVELLFTSAVLETGYAQPEAIGLYQKVGYSQIPNYGQYKHVESSVCFEKYLKV